MPRCWYTVASCSRFFFTPKKLWISTVVEFWGLWAVCFAEDECIGIFFSFAETECWSLRTSLRWLIKMLNGKTSGLFCLVWHRCWGGGGGGSGVCSEAEPECWKGSMFGIVDGFILECLRFECDFAEGKMTGGGCCWPTATGALKAFFVLFCFSLLLLLFFVSDAINNCEADKFSGKLSRTESTSRMNSDSATSWRAELATAEFVELSPPKQNGDWGKTAKKRLP